jgi:hypothetical protein
MYVKFFTQKRPSTVVLGALVLSLSTAAVGLGLSDLTDKDANAGLKSAMENLVHLMDF